ncbi:MAG TPA: hypothetical protein VF618_16080 [Thermoanaerobaculia bacterium]
MNSPNRGNDRDDIHHTNPDHAATDPRAAAQQDQVKADHDALAEQARRVEASVPDNVTDPRRAATDPEAAATQDRVKADHDRMAESARRVEASVPADVRDTPIQAANLGTASEDEAQSRRNVDSARANADAARESARRTEDEERRR